MRSPHLDRGGVDAGAKVAYASSMRDRFPADARHAFFSTPLGECGVAWSERGLLLVQLPERSPEATRAHFAGSTEADPPAWVADALDRIARHLASGAEDLSSVPLDLAIVPPFFRRVYEVTRAVAPGEVRTYAEIAAAAGSPAATRAVGQALAKNPFPIVVPCHRVLAAGNRPGGFSAPGGLDTKARLLAVEGRTLGRPLQAAFVFGEAPNPPRPAASERRPARSPSRAAR